MGSLVQVPMAERAELPEGSYYVSDLVGCEVFAMSGEMGRIGVVRDVDITGEEQKGTPILVIESVTGEEVMIPLAQEICKVDLANKRIEIRPPEGLMDLNLKSTK